jgi:hypothetical protein
MFPLLELTVPLIFKTSPLNLNEAFSPTPPKENVPSSKSIIEPSDELLKLFD